MLISLIIAQTTPSPILPSQYWNETLNCAPYQSLAEAVTVGFLRCHILSSIVALREEIDQQLSDSKNLPSQYIFLKGVGRALVAIRPRQEHMLTVENFKQVGSRIPPEICILEMNRARRDSLNNGGAAMYGSNSNNSSNLSGSMEAANKDLRERLLNKKRKPSLMSKDNSSVFDTAPEESAQELRNRVNKGVKDRQRAALEQRGRNSNSNNNRRNSLHSVDGQENRNPNKNQFNGKNQPRSSSLNSRKGNNNNSLNDSITDSPRRSKNNSVRFPPVETRENVVEYDSDILPRHYPIEAGNVAQRRVSLVNNGGSSGSDFEQKRGENFWGRD